MENSNPESMSDQWNSTDGNIHIRIYLYAEPYQPQNFYYISERCQNSIKKERCINTMRWKLLLRSSDWHNHYGYYCNSCIGLCTAYYQDKLDLL
jgi:hypothetical protein